MRVVDWGKRRIAETEGRAGYLGGVTVYLFLKQVFKRLGPPSYGLEEAHMFTL